MPTGALATAGTAGDPASTGTIGTEGLPPVNSTGLLGSDPNDDLNQGKRQFRANNFGIAERYFRRAVETHPRDAEAWVGLAASYDRLRRFDLADRAYRGAIGIIGETPEVLNNQGYSYMLRGDYAHARSHAAGGPGQGRQESLHPQQSRIAREELSQRQGHPVARPAIGGVDKPRRRGRPRCLWTLRRRALT